MKKQICRILMLVTITLSFSVFVAKAQAVNNQIVDNEINTLESEIKAKQKRILDLKLQKLKEQQEEIQNELKNLETPNSSSKAPETVLPTDTKVIAKPEKPLVKVGQPPKQEEPAGNGSLQAQNQTTDVKCNNFNITSRSPLDNNLCNLARDFQVNADLRANEKNLAVLVMYLAQTDESIKRFILEFENKRTDKQIGSNSTNKGTTSLAIKGGTPKILGWAIEHGAATSTISGNTVNIRVNPIGLLDAFARNSNQLPFGNRFTSLPTSPINFSVDDLDDSFTKFAKKASLGFSFDTTRGTDPPTFIGSKQQLSAVSFRYEFINHRDPLRTEFNDDWNAFFQSQISTLTNQLDAVGLLLKDIRDPNREFKNAQLEKWVADTQTELEKLPNDTDGKRNFTAIREKIEERLKVLPIAEILKDVTVKKALKDLAEYGAKYHVASTEFLKKLNTGTLVTFEYTNNKEVNAADTSNFNFIAEFGRKFGDGIMDVTFNSSLTMFNRKPTGANVKKIKDFNFTAQADFPFPNFIDSVLSFSGKYIRQQSNAINPNGTVAPNTKGDIAVGQIKLTIPIPDWGVRLPLSLTFANRTELVKESIVRGNFGVTFDLDSIFVRSRLF